MIERKDSDTIRKVFLIYDTNLNDYMFAYIYQHRKAKKLLGMNVQLEAGDFMHLYGVDYYQIDKQGSCKFRFEAAQFYRALKDNRVSLRGIRPKDGGTTGQKLRVIPLLETLISPGVRVCSGGKFYNLQYEKATRSGEMIVALTCKEDDKRYVP